MSIKRVLHGDCFDLFPQVADKSADLIFADLPYGTTKCKWDTTLPLDKLWTDYKRGINGNGWTGRYYESEEQAWKSFKR